MERWLKGHIMLVNTKAKIKQKKNKTKKQQTKTRVGQCTAEKPNDDKVLLKEKVLMVSCRS